jgi:hypothetical protein
MEAPECGEYNDYFELELVLEYENAVPLPQGGVLAPELVAHLERVTGLGLQPLLRRPLTVMFGSIDAKETQMHLRGVLLTTHTLEGWTWTGQLTHSLREGDPTEPLLAGVRNDMVVVTKRPERNARQLCHTLHEYDRLHAQVRHQLYGRFSDDGRRGQRLGLQYWGQEARVTRQAMDEMIDNAHYHKRYLLAVPPTEWLAQYDDLLTTFLRRNAREQTRGFSPVATGMRNVLERIAQALHQGVQRVMQRLPPAYPDLHLEDWDAGKSTLPEDPRMYAQAQEDWWYRDSGQR